MRHIPLEKITALPFMHRATIPESYRDAMGHMNVRYYLGLFDDAAWNFFKWMGLELKADEPDGIFALQQFISYLAEVHIGDTVAIHTRLIAVSDKRLQKVHFMVNETQSKLAATMEVMAIHVDMTTRKAAPFPPKQAAALHHHLSEFQALDWEAPLSGAIHV